MNMTEKAKADDELVEVIYACPILKEISPSAL